ncbi:MULTISPECIES: c-type cytochrome biogenesis protein CcmI [unclassified Shinella]|uniref:c-type cytochrome biogenesis protein CcmI n=1 Tax=unclassified Shinella TaxID=2643062 RepID=UPI00225DA187|nr:MULTISPECIES: c-type cytochrome biogenesis protein CcmI [unclassified Shinella]MCO5136219.1 c-type cytochrome biogenesis protein CcmI [Shinella sp.]MDC7254144.1 c-type cytochrome biogenesis protein CcmI [Shinella sp. YE25]CAI0336815.1 Cytochrome c-type biogenesis protein CycH [Rhizobiaceae bacterium]CAK7255341.1 Cytochrome c-type biogenesis protein CycH [Shinella sp. WSC3-e]
MFFWILVAILTAAVAAVLLLPLLRRPPAAAGDAGHDVEVYRDQLEELKRDEASGLIGANEAELARAEVARRLIAASKAEAKGGAGPAGRRNRLAQVFVIVLLPTIGLCLYVATGRPDLPAQPLAERLANPGNDISILIAKAENHLARNPDDGAGWDLLAPIYYRSGRVEDAANAFSQAIRLLGPTPERLDGYAETLIAQSNGIVTAEARARLEQSLTLKADNPRAEYYLALALEQEGKRTEARAAFEALAKQAPADAPWLPLVNRHIAGLAEGQGGGGGALGNPTADDMAAAQDMSADDRQQMISGMVESLAAKLQENPDNIEGWMRIIRSYVVLDQRPKAEAALQTALKTFPADSDNGKQLLALARDLSISAEGSGP